MYSPIVLTDAAADSLLMATVIFGPVPAITLFDGDGQVWSPLNVASWKYNAIAVE